jgi:hypothetical protein
MSLYFVLRTTFVCALFSTLCCNPLRAETTTEPPQTRNISLRECIDLALARSLGVQIARLNPTIAQYELKAYSGIYDPTLVLAASRNYVNQPENFDPKKLGASRIDQEYEQTIDRIGPSLGGRLPFGLHYDFYARTEPNDAFNVPSQLRTNNFYSVAGVSFRQPLLKDFWIDADRRNIKLARSDLKISNGSSAPS